MYALNSPLTAAPDVNSFQSPFEKGYGAGFEQMSDAMKRMQQKRQLDQADVQLQQNARQQSIDVWKAQLQASISQKQIAVQEQSNNQEFGLQTAKQNFEIEQSRLLQPLKKMELEAGIQKTLSDTAKNYQEVDQRKAGMFAIQDASSRKDYSISDPSQQLVDKQEKQATAIKENLANTVEASRANLSNAPSVGELQKSLVGSPLKNNTFTDDMELEGF